MYQTGNRYNDTSDLKNNNCFFVEINFTNENLNKNKLNVCRLHGRVSQILKAKWRDFALVIQVRA